MLHTGFFDKIQNNKYEIVKRYISLAKNMTLRFFFYNVMPLSPHNSYSFIPDEK